LKTSSIIGETLIETQTHKSFCQNTKIGKIFIEPKIFLQSQKGRKTGRQEDRKTERQDRKAERQKDRKTERQKDRKTERKKDRKTGRQKDFNRAQTVVSKLYDSFHSRWIPPSS
jgi:hypothetical protein